MEPRNMRSFPDWTEYVGSLESYQMINDNEEVELNYESIDSIRLTRDDFYHSGLAEALKLMELPRRISILKSDYDTLPLIRWRDAEQRETEKQQ